jgi:hypothetical protein
MEMWRHLGSLGVSRCGSGVRRGRDDREAAESTAGHGGLADRGSIWTLAARLGDVAARWCRGAAQGCGEGERAGRRQRWWQGVRQKSGSLMASGGRRERPRLSRFQPPSDRAYTPRTICWDGLKHEPPLQIYFHLYKLLNLYILYLYCINKIIWITLYM